MSWRSSERAEELSDGRSARRLARRVRQCLYGPKSARLAEARAGLSDNHKGLALGPGTGGRLQPGANLLALRAALAQGTELSGVEPNGHALRIAATEGFPVVAGDITRLPFGDRAFDLVMTVGVLTHLADAPLSAGLAELHRCSRRYLLAIEYFDEEDTTVPYRGVDDMLWKRPFLRHYQIQFSTLRLVGHGTLDQSETWDRCTWWLLEKQPEG